MTERTIGSLALSLARSLAACTPAPQPRRPALALSVSQRSNDDARELTYVLPEISAISLQKYLSPLSSDKIYSGKEMMFSIGRPENYVRSPTVHRVLLIP